MKKIYSITVIICLLLMATMSNIAEAQTQRKSSSTKAKTQTQRKSATKTKSKAKTQRKSSSVKTQTQRKSSAAKTSTRRTRRVPKEKPPKYELSGALNGGISHFKYAIDEGSSNIGFGGGIEMGYTYILNEHFGLFTAFGLSIYNSSMSMNSFSEQYMTIDENGDDFRFNYSLSGYREKQIATMLSVPLMVRYLVPLGGRKSTLKYVVAGGVKIQLPLSMSTQAIINPGTVTTSGYYAYEERTYTNLPRHGFVNNLAVEQFGRGTDLSIVPMLAFETGIRFAAGANNIDLRVYFEHSVTDIRKSKNNHIVEYQSSYPSQFKYNSVLNSGMVNKVRLFGAGLKVGIFF
jgi:hypothetical protein